MKNLKALEEQIDHLILGEYKTEYIKNNFKKLGWSEKDIEYALNKINKRLKKLNQYINSLLYKGYGAESIKQALIKVGWSEQYIDHLFKKRKIS